MIYLDNNATTHPLPEVIRAVTDALERYSWNPSSAHSFGTVSRRLLDSARETVAAGFGLNDASQIVFTSCGTESINAAFSLMVSKSVTQIVISSVEHSAVIQAATRWADGRKIHHIPVSSDGVLDFDALTRRITGTPSLVSLALANNETGVITDIPAVARNLSSQRRTSPCRCCSGSRQDSC